MYQVQASGDVPLVAEVKSDGTLDAVLSLVSTDEPGSSRSTFGERRSGADGPARRIDGSLLFAVTPYERSSGDFRVLGSSREVTLVAVGDTAANATSSGRDSARTPCTRGADPVRRVQ